MKSLSYYTKFLYVAFFMGMMQLMIVSCDDDPGAEHYYTTTSEYASDFLLNREKFSEFSKIVQRTYASKSGSNMMDLLGTWGSYTVFAPTNEAVEKYLHSRGLTSVDELTQEDCDTITKNHIIEQAFFVTDFDNGTYPVMNMLDRPLTVTSIALDENGNPIETKKTSDEEEQTEESSEPEEETPATDINSETRLGIFINKTARMIQMDDSVENGVVHTMNSVIGTNNDMVADLLSKDESVSIFYEALQITHMDDSLQKFIDPNYSVGKDSVDWTNDRLCIHTAVEYDNVAYMEKRYFKYTALVEQNSVYEKYGVTDIEGLKQLAKQIYDPKYPEDADITDPTDRRNSLNRFVSYHLLPFQGTYYTLTCVDGPNSTLAKNFNRRYWDIADWYETMMPYSIMKFSFPNGQEQGLYVNRRGIQSRADGRGYKYRGAKVIPADQAALDQTAINGVYHYIDDIISYGVQPDGVDIQDYVFSERMRIDCSTLSPDFLTSGARGHYTRTTYDNGKYGEGGQGAIAASNKNTCLGFKAGTAINWKYTDATHVHVRNRVLTFWSYEGDEVTIKGRFDVTIKLPPVPAGLWEVRMFTCVDFPSRGIVQYYIDNIPQGIPFDMRPSGNDPKIGWKSDQSLGDEELIAAFDKEFHNRQWMKGPKSYWSATTTAGGAQGQIFRDAPNTLRKVVGTFTSDGRTDHYLRLQQKMESENNELNFDMIELCPSTVFANPDVAEDRW